MDAALERDLQLDHHQACLQVQVSQAEGGFAIGQRVTVPWLGATAPATVISFRCLTLAGERGAFVLIHTSTGLWLRALPLAQLRGG